MTRHRLGSTMRVLRPAPHVLAFYDGRVDGVRAWSDAPNWLDDGAYELGTCSYAIVDGPDALVYDTHMSIPHADRIRQVLEANGVRSIRVVLSHWHVDHVAGNATFQDCEIIANTLTAQSLAERKAALESGTPPIRPLIGPTRTFETRLDLRVGSISVELHRFDIHSRDGTVIVLPEAGLLFAGDTLEDPVTYVVEPDRLEHHLIDLDRLSGLTFARIFPNHGAVAQIEGGGYGRGLIDATRRYVEKIIGCRDEPDWAHQDLRTFIGPDLEAGNVHYWAAYEAVHRANIARVSSRHPDVRNPCHGSAAMTILKTSRVELGGLSIPAWHRTCGSFQPSQRLGFRQQVLEILLLHAGLDDRRAGMDLSSGPSLSGKLSNDG